MLNKVTGAASNLSRKCQTDKCLKTTPMLRELSFFMGGLSICDMGRDLFMHVKGVSKN